MVTKNIFFQSPSSFPFFLLQSQYSFSSRLKVHKIPFEDILKELKILEKKLQLQYKSTYEKDFTPKPIDLYQKSYFKRLPFNFKNIHQRYALFLETL